MHIPQYTFFRNKVQAHKLLKICNAQLSHSVHLFLCSLMNGCLEVLKQANQEHKQLTVAILINKKIGPKLLVVLSVCAIHKLFNSV
jgi:hypothetical protein